MTTSLDFYSLTRPELAAYLAERFSAPRFRADQLFQWVYRRRTTDFAAMSDIGRKLRAAFAGAFDFPRAAMERREISSDGTRKYLFRLDGGDLVETVMIKQPSRMTLCVSSQVGCGMACAFCRTGTMGFRRHLSASEIVRQVSGVIEDAANFGDMFQNIVFMGMGEPLHNFDGIARAISILTDQFGFDISARKITVSTVGLVPAIERFFSEGVRANLAVSLNATTDAVRSEIMPVNKAYPIERLLGTLRAAPLKPRQRITIEYVMLAGVNDTKDDMRRLVRLLEGIPSKINLIPYNTNAGLGFDTPARATVSAWREFILSKGLNVTVRWSKGQDINAACGQLVTASVRTRRTKESGDAKRAQAAA